VTGELAVAGTSDNIPARATAAIDIADRKFDFGDTITRDWMETSFGIIVPEVASRDEIQSLMLDFLRGWDIFSRGLLHHHKKALRSMGRGEWRIVMPQDQATYALEKTQGDISRAISTGRRIVQNTRTDLLSDAERSAHRDAEGRIAALNALQRRVLPTHGK